MISAECFEAFVAPAKIVKIATILTKTQSLIVVDIVAAYLWLTGWHIHQVSSLSGSLLAKLTLSNSFSYTHENECVGLIVLYITIYRRSTCIRVAVSVSVTECECERPVPCGATEGDKAYQ